MESSCLRRIDERNWFNCDSRTGCMDSSAFILIFIVSFCKTIKESFCDISNNKLFDTDRRRKRGGGREEKSKYDNAKKNLHRVNKAINIILDLLN